MDAHAPTQRPEPMIEAYIGVGVSDATIHLPSGRRYAIAAEAARYAGRAVALSVATGLTRGVAAHFVAREFGRWYATTLAIRGCVSTHAATRRILDLGREAGSRTSTWSVRFG